MMVKYLTIANGKSKGKPRYIKAGELLNHIHVIALITYLSVSYGSSPPELGSEHIPPTLSQEREQRCYTLNGEKKRKRSNNLY